MSISSLKQQLLNLVKQKLLNKIEILQKNIRDLQSAAEEETKSSAGDKYETSREMLQQEQDKYGSQLAVQLKLLQVLNQVKPNELLKKASFGALIQTNKACYFLTISLGKITFAEKTYFIISPAAPLGQKLLDKTVGDQFNFRGQIIKIDAIA